MLLSKLKQLLWKIFHNILMDQRKQKKPTFVQDLLCTSIASQTHTTGCECWISYWKSQETKDIALLCDVKSFHQDAYSRTKFLYNSVNSNITSPSSQYTPTKWIHPCVPHVLVVHSFILFSWLCLLYSAFQCLSQWVCAMLVTSTVLPVILDFVTFYLVTRDVTGIKMLLSMMMLVRLRVIMCALHAYNGSHT